MSDDFFRIVQGSTNGSIWGRFVNWFERDTHYAILLFITLVGFVLRLIKALQATGIYHPDEIFQSLEMAHLIVYNTGLVPPEFRSENSVEYYYASRSWIFPWIFAILMYIGEFLNMDYHTGILPMIRIALALNSTMLIPVSKKFVTQLTNDNTAGIVAAFFVAIWWRLIEISVRPFSNTFFLPMLFYGLYRMLLVIKNEKIENYDHFIIAIFVGLSTYIRLDLGIIVFAFFITTLNLSKLGYKIQRKKIGKYNLSYPSLNNYGSLYINFLYDGIIGWLFGILVDFNYYGKIFTVPVNWVMFAIKNGDIFGVSDRFYYYENIVELDGLLLYFLIAVITFIFLISVRFKYILNIDNSLINGYIRLFVITIIVWLIQSNAWDKESHKELRFISGGMVLLLLSMGVATKLMTDIVTEYITHATKDRYKIKSKYIVDYKSFMKIWLVIMVCILLIFQSIAYQDSRGQVETFDDINSALVYVGNQQNVTGVIVVNAWFLSGSYTYLHRNVPVFYAELTTGEPIPITLQIKIKNNSNEYNYLILPYFQLARNGDIINDLLAAGWGLERVIDGKSEIWSRSA